MANTQRSLIQDSSEKKTRILNFGKNSYGTTTIASRLITIL